MITKAYGGKVIITFNDAKHYYTVTAPTVFKDSLYQPSVTGIIGMKDKSAGLVHWSLEQFASKMKRLIETTKPEHLDATTLPALVDVAKDTWRVTKQQAADIGTIAHKVFEETLEGREVRLPLRYDAIVSPNITQDMIDQANNAVDAGLQFIREHEIRIIQSEAPRWSPTHGYIGTGDLIAYIDGKLSVLDWKTSKRLYPTVRLQLSAYKHAYEEEYPQHEIEQRVAVNTGKDGSLSYEVHTNETHAEDFKVFLALLNVWRWDRVNQGQWSKAAPRLLTKSEVRRLLNKNS